MKTYEFWAQYHASLFGLHTDADLEMLLAWARLFEKHGYTPDELMQASDFMAIHNPCPKWEHLRAIKDAIFQQRSALQEAARQEKQAQENAQYQAVPPAERESLLAQFRAFRDSIGKLPQTPTTGENPCP